MARLRAGEVHADKQYFITGIRATLIQGTSISDPVKSEAGPSHESSGITTPWSSGDTILISLAAARLG